MFANPENREWRVCYIPKVNKPGSYRKITIPNDELKAVQKEVLEYLYSVPELWPTAYAHGFVPGRSTITGVERHDRMSEVLACMDIKDFFDNFPVDEVRREMIQSGVGITVTDEILGLCTYNNTIPQGGPCSPFLTNIGMRHMDNMLGMYARGKGMTYSRYADDLTFGICSKTCVKGMSLDAIFTDVDRMLKKSLKLHLNRAKSHLLYLNGHTGRTVNGVVIRQDGLGYNAPHKMRYIARAMNHRLYKKLHGIGRDGEDLDGLWARLKGYVCYMDGLRAHSDSQVAGADPVIQVEYWNYNQKNMEK